MDLSEYHDWWKHFGASELRHLLLLWWDPIGVYGTKEAVDEYDRYSGQIAAMLREGADAAAITSYLGDVTDERMGIGRNPSRDAAATERIFEWWDRAMQLTDGPPSA